MAPTKNTAKRALTVAKHEGIRPTQALDALVDYAYAAWLDKRVACNGRRDLDHNNDR